ncbi:MAG: DoxX-like family protein [Acinetobacter sp.]
MEKSLRNILWTIHITLAVLWVYQGLIPKVLYKAQDEQYIWQQQGFDELISLILMQFSGYIEIIFGMLFLVFKQSKILHFLNILRMLGLSLLIAIIDMRYFQNAFYPFVMNVAMASLSIIALQLLQAKNPKL